jgi:hypothetical protein
MRNFCFEIFLMSSSQHTATRRRGNKKASLRSSILTSRGPAKTFGAIMTSISATSSSSYLSPLQKLQDELQSEVNSGAIGSSDQSALSSALTDISSSLHSSQAGDSAGGTNSSPGDLKSRIDNLIAGEVSSGRLTSDQATSCRASSRQRSPMAPTAVQAAQEPHPTAITAVMAVRRPPTVRLRPAAPAPSSTFCSSFSSRCRIRVPLRHRRRTARPASPTPAPTAQRHPRRF